jgi:hypothetical protein
MVISGYYSAKVPMKDLSELTCECDASLFHEMTRRWVEYYESLEALSSITIDRWLGTSETQNVQLHGFCDASTRAYAAAVYLRVVNTSGSFGILLIASRSKVAPIKPVNILNFELCGAVLLVQLVKLLKLKFIKLLKIKTIIKKKKNNKKYNLTTIICYRNNNKYTKKVDNLNIGRIFIRSYKIRRK